MLRSHYKLLAVVFGLLLAVPAIALASDVLSIDGDALTSNADTTIDLGTVDPGQAIKASDGNDYQVSFQLACDVQGSNRTHVTADKIVKLTYSQADSQLDGTIVSATDATITKTPTTWPADGSNCPATAPTLNDTGNSTLTMTAPKASGKKTVNLAYTYTELNADGTPYTLEDDKAIQGGFPGTKTVKYTMTVRNLPPAISSVDGPGTVVVGDQKQYTVNASDPNDDALTYTNTVSGPATFVTGTATTSTPKLNFTGTGPVTLTSTVKDTANQTATKTTSITVNPADSTPPTVSSINRGNPEATNASTVPWLVTFSENVSGVDVGDFQTANPGGGLTGTGVANVTQASGSTYTVGASTGSGNGTLRLDVVDNDTIKDAANNPLGGAGNGNGDFATGQTYTVDKTKPVISASAKTQPDGLDYTAGTWTNKDVQVSFSCADTLSGVDTSNVAGATLNTNGADQSVTNTGTCKDKAGNTADSATFSNIDIDKVAPVVTNVGPDSTFSTPNAAGWYKSDVKHQFTATDNLSGFPQSGIVQEGDLSQRIFKTITQEGSAVTIGSGTVTDRAGNVGQAETSPAYKIDKTAPTIRGDRDPQANADGWSNTDVTVSWTCDDGLSGVVSCPDPTTVSSEGKNPSVKGVVSDQAGNTASGLVSGINIDKTNPTISASVLNQPAPNGWYNVSTGGPNVHFECSDALSGIATGACPADHTVTDEGASVPPYSGSVSDKAGNSNSASAGPFKIDLTLPAAAGHPDLTTDSGDATDNLTNVKAPTFDVTAEAGSTVKLYAKKVGGTETLIGQGTATNGTATITSNQNLADGTYDVYAHVTDQAGNASDTSVLNITIVSIDATAPQLTLPANITEEATSAAGATVTYAASANDAVDGNVAVNCSKNSGTTFALGTTTVNCSATDRAGNTASSSFDVTVRDTTAPVIAPHGDVTAEATSSGGALVTYASPATSDAVDGAKTANCTPASGGQFPLGDTTITCNATDAAGNHAIPTTFKVTVKDTTAPTLDSHLDVSETATSSSGAVINYTKPNATDAVTANPTVNCTPAPGATFPIGTTTVSCTATDAAGNTSLPNTFKVNVSVSWSGFMQPINTVANMGTAYKQSVFKIGSTVPVKFQLTGASAGITDGNFYLKYIRTGNGDGLGESEVVATATGNTGTQFRYDATAGQYIFNWSTKGISLAGNYEVRVYTDAAMTNLMGSQSIELKK